MPWTNITKDTSWQELAIASEIAEAYNWRVAALPEAWRAGLGLAEIDPNENMTVRDFVRAVQDGIEAMAPYFSDPELDLSGLTEYPIANTVFRYDNAQELFDAAGLTGTGGWRRISEGNDAPDPWTSYGAAGWEYGKIGDKDLAGPWLFKDLQLAMAKLYRRIGNPDVIESYMEAVDDATNEEDHPVWPALTPDSPGYVQIDLPSPHVGSSQDGQYFVFAADAVVDKQIIAYARYTDFAFSGLIAGNTSLKDLSVWVWVSGNIYGPPYTDFGTGMTLNRLNKVAEKTGTTDVTITARSLPEVTSWAALVGAVAMPTGGESFIYEMSTGLPVADIVYRWAR